MRNLYITTAFSLAMLSNLTARGIKLWIEEIDLVEVKLKLSHRNLYKKIWRIGHLSTAEVLSKLLNKYAPRIEIPEVSEMVDRTPISLKIDDRVLVFQLLKRPAEGQVYTEKEVQEIVDKNLYKFYFVEVRG